MTTLNKKKIHRLRNKSNILKLLQNLRSLNLRQMMNFLREPSNLLPNLLKNVWSDRKIKIVMKMMTLINLQLSVKNVLKTNKDG